MQTFTYSQEYVNDFHSPCELIASDKTTAEIAKYIGADSITYITMDRLVKSIDLPQNNLCLSCLNAKYPNN